MLKVGLIGLGEIAKHHKLGLEKSAVLELVSVCDRNPKAAARNLFPGLPFYTDSHEMIEREPLDIVVIATPPETHTSLIQDCISHGIFALSEKPLDTSWDNCLKLLPNINKSFDIIYHWMFSQEVLWFKRCIRLRKIQKIVIAVSDPYADANGNIDPEKRALGGSWIDSGVNVLSMLSLWVDIRRIKSLDICHERDASCGIPYHTQAVSKEGDLPEIVLDIRWDCGVNFKQTRIVTEKHTYILNHTQQAVFRDDEEIFRDNSISRLDRHYYNFYTLYPSSLIPGKTSTRIHELIFKNL